MLIEKNEIMIKLLVELYIGGNNQFMSKIHRSSTYCTGLLANKLINKKKVMTIKIEYLDSVW